MENKRGAAVVRVVHGRTLCCTVALIVVTTPAGAFRPPELSAPQQRELRANFALSVAKLKGPYTENFCVCQGGEKLPVAGPNGKVRSPCGPSPLFCAAYRAPWAEALAHERMYIANIFSRDLYIWDSFRDHNDLVRGYILEKYFIETNPDHKLAQLRSYGGLSGAEYETEGAGRFFERYLVAPEFNDTRNFLLAYELQKRYFLHAEVGQIDKVRAMSVRIQAVAPKFKPLRDAIHNQMSAGLIPQLVAYRDTLPQGSTRTQVGEIIAEIGKLTATDESTLEAQVAEIQDAAWRSNLVSLVPAPNAQPVDAISSLGELMVLARQTVAARTLSPADARRLVDLNVTAAAGVQRRGSSVLEGGKALPVKQHLQLLSALTDATYGAGLLGERERAAATSVLRNLIDTPKMSREDFKRKLERAERIVEWAQANALLGFAEVWAPWTFLLPQIAGIRDDILRASPLLLYVKISGRLDDFAAGTERLEHDLFGASVKTDIRALNPGIVLGRLRVAPRSGTYNRDEVVALPETPADLDPAAGILTQGEGNVLSHVQLLARALGIPNVVLGPSAYEKLRSHDGKPVFFIATPGGRVILKEASAMTAEDHAVYEEYTRNQERTADGSLGAHGPRLHVDRDKVDLSKQLPIDLSAVRRSDSGRFCGPKAAYLGELKHLFPDHVSRGIVVPFGAYYNHYQHAMVTVPEKLRPLGLATPDEPLPDFVARSYKEFFDVLIPAKKSERELSAWIAPRLDIIRHSIRQAALSAELKRGIRDGLDRNGLLESDDKARTVGCFVRSDTNAEDLDNFNGAGLNLTLFNRKSLDDIYEGLKEVWASPFALRSFSWRQTLIDDPLWVLSSAVILESIRSEKSGVLVTADPNGEPGKMLVVTSEGVGGAVDGASAETLLWSPAGIELVTLFKSPWRSTLLPGGGSKIVPSSGRDTVLEPEEIKKIIAAGQAVTEKFVPVRGPSGKPRPWDIEFGFVAGKLWLFQSRPFLGNNQLKNIPALAPLEITSSKDSGRIISLEEVVR